MGLFDRIPSNWKPGSLFGYQRGAKLYPAGAGAVDGSLLRFDAATGTWKALAAPFPASGAEGDILYFSASGGGWTRLASPGVRGEVLVVGPSTTFDPVWVVKVAPSAIGLTTNGDLVTQAAGVLDRIAVSAPAANVRNVLGADNGDTAPSYKTALDATNPTTSAIADSASPGTSLVFSHRDHTHGRETAATIGAALFPAWTTVSFTAGDFTAASGNWTVASGDLTTFAYMLIGKTMIVTIQVATSTVSATPSDLRILIPGGKTAARSTSSLCFIGDVGSFQAGLISTIANDTKLYINKVTLATWGTSTDTTYVYATHIFETT